MSLKIRLFRDDRTCLALILPLALLLSVIGLGQRDLWDPDEPRAGLVVRSILASGSWSALTLHDQPYFEKPPLYHWLAAAASLPAGRVTEESLRLPSSLAAVLCAVVVFTLGRALFGRRVGALGAIVLCTSQDYFMEARTAHPDMLFTLLLALAALAFHRAYARRGAVGWMACFYAAVGLAALTKGPLGLALPALAILAYLASLRDLSFARRAGLAWGAPLALLPSAIWLAAFRAGTGRNFPVGEALRRVGRRFAEGIHHAHPFTHVLSALAIEFLPWIVFVPGALWLTFPRRGGRRDPDNAYLYAWVLVLFSVFALSVEKRGVYLLPLLPFLALLVGRFWDTALFDWDPPPGDRFIVGGLVAGVVLTAGAAAHVLPRLAAETPALRRPGEILTGLILLAGAAALVALRASGGGAALAALAAGLLPCYLAIALIVLPALDPFKSARPFSQRAVAAAAGAPLGIYPDPHDGLAFYAGRPITILADRDQLGVFLRADPDAACLMEETQLELVRRDVSTQPRLPSLEAVDRAEVGHRAILLVRAASPIAPPDGGTRR